MYNDFTDLSNDSLEEDFKDDFTDFFDGNDIDDIEDGYNLDDYEDVFFNDNGTDEGMSSSDGSIKSELLFWWYWLIGRKR